MPWRIERNAGTEAGATRFLYASDRCATLRGVSLKRHLPLVLWLTLVAGLSTVVAVDPRGWRHSLKLNDEVLALTAKNAAVSQENQRLSREARALKTNPVAMERAVRDELGFIHPGEMVLQLRPAARP
jgi:cell division protein FtsB